MPNEKFVNALQGDVVSVDSVEQLTSIDLFSALPDDMGTKLEAASDR